MSAEEFIEENSAEVSELLETGSVAVTIKGKRFELILIVNKTS